MKLRTLLTLSCSLLTIIWTSDASIIAQWTFETSIPTTSGPHSPEVGSGSALGSHASSLTTYSNPVGNGSMESFSSDRWAVGDFWQFQVSTIGHSGISLSWDQISSGTGPGRFTLQYSTDSISYTIFSSYSVIENTGANGWSSGGSPKASSHFGNIDLSGITALNGLANVYFRLAVDTSASASGGTIGTGGTSRIDNFTIEATPVPEPSTWLAGALVALPFGVHGIRYLRNRKRA